MWSLISYGIFLQELYALVDFVNPGVLGTSASFRRIYEEPIIAYQQPTATESEKELGNFDNIVILWNVCMY